MSSSSKYAHQAQHGLSLFQLLLLMLVLSSTIVMAMSYIQTQYQQRASETDAEILKRANQILENFSAFNARMPCPDINQDGIEDCTGMEQAGYLPFKTLGLQQASPKLRELKYLVYRSMNYDLVKATNSFEPKKLDGTSYAFNQIGGSDFCYSAMMAKAEVNTNATMAGSGVQQRRIAYAIISPGVKDADGDGQHFDGLHRTVLNAVELPERAHDRFSYDDVVLTRSFDELLMRQDCLNVLASIDTMSLSAQVVSDAQTKKIMTTAVASIISTIALIKAGVLIGKMAGSIATIATASTVLTVATTELASAISGCVFLIGCLLIPHAIASVVAATLAVASGLIAVALYVPAFIAQVTAFGLSLAVAALAGIEVDKSGMNLDNVTKEAKDAWDKSQTTTRDAKTEWDKSLTEEASSKAERDRAWSDLFTTGYSIVANVNNSGYQPNGLYLPAIYFESRMFDLDTRYQEWFRAGIAKDAAQDALNNSQSTVQNGGAGIHPKLQEHIDKLKVDMQNESDPERKKILQKVITDIETQGTGTGDNSEQLNRVRNSISQLETQLAKETDAQRKQIIADRIVQLRQQENTLNSSVEARQSALNSANNAYNSSNSNLNNSRDSLIESANFTTCVWNSKDKKNDCKNYDARGSMRGAVNNFLDKEKTWLPKGEAVRMKKQAYDKAVENEAGAKKAYETLLDLKNNANGTTPSALSIWEGVEPILKAAERKGNQR
jgi:hypothetical protein